MEKYSNIPDLIHHLETEGIIKRTFRRLDPERQMVIIGAVLSEAAETGPSAINIKRVAERAGVAVGSLYQYFGSRDGLLDFAIRLVVEETTHAFQFYQDELVAMPVKDALWAYVEGGIEWANQMPGIANFYAKAAYTGDLNLVEKVVRPIGETMLGLVRGMLIAAQARGELVDTVDLEATARFIHACSIAMIDPVLLPYLNAYFQVAGPDCRPERTLEAAFNMILAGLCKTQEET